MTERRAKIAPDELPDDSLADRHYQVPDRVAHYLRDVLRLEPGDPVELFDGEGRVLDARIQVSREDRVRLAILADRYTERNESPCRVTLCAALPERKRWRWILEKTTELGVATIVPLETDHGVVEIPDDRRASKYERWERIVGEAARQCERTHTPDVADPASPADVLGSEFDGPDVVLHARREATSLAEYLRGTVGEESSPTRARLWIGPEGGFSDEELTRLTDADVAVCTLGPRILRAETAAVVATALIQQELGDLSQSRD
jgi:16S rRNA (uracil1498-N3)-methyltransferase